MLDQTLVQSGFDAEILLGERQLTYLLLTLVDAGRIPMEIQIPEPPITLKLRGPLVVDRTYEPHPEAPGLPTALDALHPLQVEILFGHPSGADLRVHVVLDKDGWPVEGDLFITLALDPKHEGGLLTEAKLGVTLVDIASGILPAIEASYGKDKAFILSKMKEQVDRTIDLGGIGTFKRIHDLAYQKVPSDGTHPAALALYVNLRLRNGAEEDDLVPVRGALTSARNFLPQGSDVAMASRPDLYGQLAADVFHRFAEIDENGDVSHPWRKSPFNPKSKKIGSIVGVSAGPSLTRPNALRVDVEVEYEIDNFIDPNAHLVLTLTPGSSPEGTFRWKVDADFHASLALELIGLVTLMGLVALTGGIAGLGFGAAIAAGVVGGSLGDALLHVMVDELYSGRVEAKVDAGLPDVVSGRVEVAQRRWDPLYETFHKIGIRPDGALVNAQGIAIWGRAVIDREVKPLAHAVIRDKQAVAPSPPTHLRYRVWDAEGVRHEFTELAPGTDRRTWSQHDPVAEPTLYQLSIDEVTGRLDEGRLVPNLAYIAKRIDMEQHQVRGILAVSQREANETRNRLVGAFEEATRAQIEADDGAQIRMDVDAAFAAAGITPTDEQRETRFNEIVAERMAPLVEAYTDGSLAGDIEVALLPLLKFSLAPEHFGALQKRKILHLLELELITMRAPGHQGFMYYRDKPDFFEPDNLLSRPRYQETENGPEIL